MSANGSILAAVAAVCWIELGLDSILRPQQIDYRDALWIVPFALTAASFLCMQRAQPRAGRLGFYSVMAASALTFAGNVGMLTDQPALAKLGFPWGAAVWTIGLILFGIATLKAGVFPRYVGIAIILLEPGSILTGLALSPIAPLHDRGAYSAGVEKGLVMALVSCGFLALRGQTVNRAESPANRECVADARGHSR